MENLENTKQTAGPVLPFPVVKSLIGCLISYITAYMLVRLMFADITALYLPFLTLLFTVWCFEFGSKPCRSRAFLCAGGLWALTVFAESSQGYLPLACGHIWQDSALPVLIFVPGFAGGLALAVSDGLCFDEWMWLDALNAFIVFPAKGALYRIRDLSAACRELGAGKRGRRRGNAPRVVIAVLFAFLLLIAATSLLAGASVGFSGIVSGLLDRLRHIRLPKIGDSILYFLLSIIPGAYMYGQIFKARETGPEALKERREKLALSAGGLKQINRGLWCGVMLVFTAVYALFTVVDAIELYNAFVRRLAPGELTMAEYARQGFFEMCAVMALNFVLVYAAEHASRGGLYESRPGRLCASAVHGASVLFALSAFSKLYMYFAAFGFTPARGRGAWGIAVLLAGCVCALIRVWTGRRAARVWLWITALSLIITLLL